MSDLMGVFDRMEDAVAAANQAFIELSETCSTEERQTFIDAIKEKTLEIVNDVTKKEFEETGYGRLDQKLIKNYGSIAENPGCESLHHTVMASGKGVTVEFASPVGLVGALTPVTNGLVTVACNTMSMLAAGNTIVFNAHPGAKHIAAQTVDLINRTVVEKGGPANVCTMVAEPTLETLNVIMESPDVKMMIGTGGEGMVSRLMAGNKKVVAAGPGNVPVLVDETCDVEKAAQTIYGFASFENTMLCISEKVAFVVDAVYDRFMETMKECGARILTSEEGKKLSESLIKKNADGKLMPDKKYVGKDPRVILADHDIEVGENPDPLLAILESQMYDPFVMCEQLMPVFPIVRCKDFQEAMEWAIEAEAGCHHSASIWTKDLDRATLFGRRIGVTCLAMNGPTVGATGAGGTGYGSATIATTTGEGFTTPNTFTRIRRFAMCGGAGYIG